MLFYSICMVPILIVDDAQEDLVFAQRVLNSNRVQNPLVPLSSGRACLEYFTGNESPKGKLPCIVLLDMVMKPVSGLDVLRKLRDLPAAEGSVIIMLSGLADTKMISEGYKLGASTFLFKPLVAAEITQMLQSINGVTYTRTAAGAVLSIRGFSDKVTDRVIVKSPKL